MTGSRYVAVLSITEAAGHTPAPPHDRRAQPTKATSGRDVVEVAKVVVRADTLDALRAKIAAHSALIAD